MMAVSNGHLECVSILVDNGADVNVESEVSDLPALCTGIWGCMSLTSECCALPLGSTAGRDGSDVS